MRAVFALLRLALLAIFLAGLVLPAPVMAASCPDHAQSVDCAHQMGGGHHAMTPGKTAPATADGCLQHCLASSLTPDPVQPAARAERVSTLTPPARLPLAALGTPEPEAPPPRT